MMLVFATECQNGTFGTLPGTLCPQTICYFPHGTGCEFVSAYLAWLTITPSDACLCDNPSKTGHWDIGTFKKSRISCSAVVRGALWRALAVASFRRIRRPLQGGRMLEGAFLGGVPASGLPVRGLQLTDINKCLPKCAALARRAGRGSGCRGGGCRMGIGGARGIGGAGPEGRRRGA